MCIVDSGTPCRAIGGLCGEHGKCNPGPYLTPDDFCVCDAGWSGVQCDTEDESSTCSACFGSTSGPCQAGNGVCYAYNPGTETCPAGTVPCGGVDSVPDDCTGCWCVAAAGFSRCVTGM